MTRLVGYMHNPSYHASMLGLGQSSSRKTIEIGHLARRDPIVAFASVMASKLLRQATARPSNRRMKWLRDELNKVQVGLGDRFVSKARELKRRGRAPDQAVFDALRLTLANQVATVMEKRISSGGLSGLGKADPRNITATFCGLVGVGTTGGVIYTAIEKNTAGSTAITAAGTQSMQSMGCNEGALRQQARIAEAELAAAQVNAAAGAGEEADDKTLTYVAIGGGVLLVSVLGFLALQ